MKMLVDHTELITLLENTKTISESYTDFAQTLLNKEPETWSDALLRHAELLLQATKSSVAIINQIRERHE